MIRRRLVYALLAAAALAWWWTGRPRGETVAGVETPIDWRREPLQTETTRPPFELATAKGAMTLTPRAAYDIAAVVAGSERYRFDDLAFLSPLDLVLTWGDLPTPAYRDKLDYSQSWRFYFWRTEDLALDKSYVIRHSANTHLIPASRNLERALLAVDAGDELRLRGLLVDSSAPNFRWPTSLVRTDHGDRGCEVLFVESAQIGDRLYR